MREGDLVAVTIMPKDYIRTFPFELVKGTFIGYLSDRRVQILLEDGTILTVKEYEVFKSEEQELL